MSRKVSPWVAQHHAADQELATEYDARMAAAKEAERVLRRAQAEQRSYDDVRELAFAFDRALLGVLAAAEATKRAKMGPRTYVDPAADPATRRAAEIAARKAKAHAHVRPWVAEVDRLRTLRERHRLTFRLQALV
jgi:hypothetical protein